MKVEKKREKRAKTRGKSGRKVGERWEELLGCSPLLFAPRQQIGRPISQHPPPPFRCQRGKEGKGKRTSFTHEVCHLQSISTFTLSVTGPPVPPDVTVQISSGLPGVTVTA